MNNTYELQTYIVVNQKEYEKLKSICRSKNYISHEICGCCGFGLNIHCGSCYNIKCEKYLRNNKQLFIAGHEYSVPVIKQMNLSLVEFPEIEDNLKIYEKIRKLKL
jgi:hypothetical protein